MKYISYKHQVLALFMGALLAVPALNARAQDEPLEDFSLELEDIPQPAPTASDPLSDQSDGADLGEVEVATDSDNSSSQPEQGLVPAANGSLSGPLGNVGEAATAGKPIPYSGSYYDTSSMGVSESGNSLAPRQVDPKYEPGSAFVVVTKSAGPNSVQARMVAAQRALGLGLNSSALEIYEQLYRERPRDKQVLMGLAVAQQQSGFKETAIATYEELLKTDANNPDAMANMLGLLKDQYPSVALSKLRELWSKNTGNANVAAELGLVNSSLGQSEEALRYLGIAATLEPRNPSHYYNMAVVNDRLGQKKLAIELYERALELDTASSTNDKIQREVVYDRLTRLRKS